MRYALFLLLAIFSACQRPGDTQPPLIGITQPKSGVLSQRSLQVQGYALDDVGVQSVKAGGKELLSEAERGQKLVRFSFRVQAPQSGQVEIRVDATDTKGTNPYRAPAYGVGCPSPADCPRAGRAGGDRSAASPKAHPALTAAYRNFQPVPSPPLQISGRVLDDTGVGPG